MHPILHHPDNIRIAEKLLFNLLLCSNAMVSTDNDNNNESAWYIQVFPEVLARAPMHTMLQTALDLGHPEASWLMHLSYGKVCQYADYQLLVKTALGNKRMRQNLLGILLDPMSPLFSPQLIPPIYQCFAAHPPGPTVRTYGANPIKPEPVPDRLLHLDALLMNWAEQLIAHDVTNDQQTIVDFPFAEINNEQDRALIALALNDLIPLDTHYHNALEKLMSEENRDSPIQRGLRHYLELFLHPGTRDQIKQRMSDSGTLDFVEYVLDPAKRLTKSLAFCVQALINRLQVLDKDFAAVIFKIFKNISDENVENMASMLLYSPLYAFNEEKAQQLAKSVEQNSLWHSMVFYKILAQWNPRYLPDHYRCCVILGRQITDSLSTPLSSKVHFHHSRTGAQQALGDAIAKVEPESPLQESYISSREILRLSPKSIDQLKSQPLTVSSPDDSKLPYTKEWYAEGNQAIRQVFRLLDSNKPESPNDVEKEYLEQLKLMDHPVAHLYPLISQPKKERLSAINRFMDIQPVIANLMPALAWYNRGYGDYNSFGYLEQLRSYYFVMRDNEMTSLMPEALDQLFHDEEIPDLGSILDEFYQTEEFDYLFQTSATTLREIVTQTLAVLTLFDRYVQAVQAGAEGKSEHFLSQLRALQSLLEQHEPNELLRFLEGLLNVGSIDTGTSEPLDNDQLIILAGHLAIAPNKRHQELGKQLIEAIKKHDLNPLVLGRGLAWLPYVYGNYRLVSMLAELLIKQKEYIMASQLFAGVIDWHWRPDNPAFIALLNQYLSFLTNHHQFVGGDQLIPFIGIYCGYFIRHYELGQLTSFAAIEILKEGLMKALPKAIYHPLVERIDRYLSYIAQQNW